MFRSLGFSPQNGEGQSPNNFLPSQTITTSVTLQLRSHHVQEGLKCDIFTWKCDTQPTWRCHPSPAQLHLGFRRFCVCLAAAGSGWPPSPCPWAAGVCWPPSQFGSCVTQSPGQASAAGREFGYQVEGGSVHSCANELVLVFCVADLFPDNWSPLKNLTFVFKNSCKTRPWFYTDAFPVFCALIPVPVLPSLFPFCYVLLVYWCCL